ncbi:hypothetical protein [Streptococcus suis]|nr:hypothetical protein [Streptococcus suis]
MKPSKNLIEDLMKITGWTKKQVLDSLVDLKKYGLIDSTEEGKLFLIKVV